MVEEKCIKVFSVFSLDHIGSVYCWGWIYYMGSNRLYGIYIYNYTYVGYIIWDTWLMYFELFLYVLCGGNG